MFFEFLSSSWPTSFGWSVNNEEATQKSEEKYPEGGNEHIRGMVHDEGGLFSPFAHLSLSIISRVYLYLPSHNGSCRLIELSSFQFDAEISPESPVEKSWWLNIEKHARPLSILARQRGGAAYLWKLLFVAAFLCPWIQMPNMLRINVSEIGKSAYVLFFHICWKLMNFQVFSNSGFSR